ncbi:MAG: phytanoyl-CoA dioxygenase family protein [Fimbriimonadaceae bacterium]|nr:phytanoyl-CoA dioxygenase family protein [Fimbriimonadaceae bacterium]
MVKESVITKFERDGYAVAEGLFSAEEAADWRRYFMEMVERGGDGWAEGGVDPEHPDPLRRYPRLLQPHRGDPIAFGYMTDPRISEHLTALAGGEPLAVQTMVYFKAPGSRGQNLHQDNTYLKAKPGTCLAAWTALEDIDEENGCMVVVPGSQNLEIMCQVEREGLDLQQWTNWETPLGPGQQAVPVHMKAGDCLFFNGSLIHGSGMNRTEDRFRVTLIGHYISAEATQVAKYYFPVYRMDGTRVEDGIEMDPVHGGPCGVYVERDGRTVIEMTGLAEEATSAH